MTLFYNFQSFLKISPQNLEVFIIILSKFIIILGNPHLRGFSWVFTLKKNTNISLSHSSSICFSWSWVNCQNSNEHRLNFLLHTLLGWPLSHNFLWLIHLKAGWLWLRASFYFHPGNLAATLNSMNIFKEHHSMSPA